MSVQAATLDVGEALQRFSGNRQILVRLLLRFLELNAAVEQKAREVLDTGKSEEVAMFFHAIKGGAANLSAKRLAEKCAQLETLAKAGDVEGVKSEFQNFINLFEELRISVEEVRNS
jgi:HPt (histidine-containing phosphotransfer) domain-containing protein